jgi:hypothetical protein
VSLMGLTISSSDLVVSLTYANLYAIALYLEKKNSYEKHEGKS